jgi:hypothetical protein
LILETFLFWWGQTLTTAPLSLVAAWRKTLKYSTVIKVDRYQWFYNTSAPSLYEAKAKEFTTSETASCAGKDERSARNFSQDKDSVDRGWFARR